MKCSECGGQVEVNPNAVRRYDIGGLPHVELSGIEVSRCPNCGVEDVTIPRIEELHRLLAGIFIRKDTILAPSEIRFLRKFVGLSTADFAQYMGKTRETVSRWETGKTPMGPSADRLLRLLVVTKAPVQDYSVDTLKEIKEKAPKRPARVGMMVGRHGWRPAKTKVPAG